MSALSRNIARREPASKVCNVCDTVYRRAQKGESNAQYAARQCCCEACRLEMISRRSVQKALAMFGANALDDKPCGNKACENILSFSGKKPTAFIRLVSCSNACGRVIAAAAKRLTANRAYKEAQPISYYWGKKTAAIQFIQGALIAGPTLRAGNSTTTEK